MIITLTPCRMDAGLTASRAGDILLLNGEALDFGPVSEGDVLPRAAINCPWIAGDVTRVSGVLRIPILLPTGPAASEAARFPAPITLTGDGPVALPA